MLYIIILIAKLQAYIVLSPPNMIGHKSKPHTQVIQPPNTESTHWDHHQHCVTAALELNNNREGVPYFELSNIRPTPYYIHVDATYKNTHPNTWYWHKHTLSSAREMLFMHFYSLPTTTGHSESFHSHTNKHTHTGGFHGNIRESLGVLGTGECRHVHVPCPGPGSILDNERVEIENCWKLLANVCIINLDDDIHSNYPVVMTLPRECSCCD